MLGVLPNSAPNDVDKRLQLTQALTKEDLEFLPGNGDVNLILHLFLVLLPAKQDGIFEENDGKWYPILTLGPGGGKMVFTLLEEIIVLQVSFTPIHAWKLGLQKPLTRAFVLLRCKSQRRSRRSQIQNGAKDPLELILQVLGHR